VQPPVLPGAWGRLRAAEPTGGAARGAERDHATGPHSTCSRHTGFWLFPKGWVSKVLICRFAYAGVVGGSQIGTESGRASRCMQQGGWVGGTLSFCMGSSVGQ
jgi:hypothetical protein